MITCLKCWTLSLLAAPSLKIISTGNYIKKNAREKKNCFAKTNRKKSWLIINYFIAQSMKWSPFKLQNYNIDNAVDRHYFR